MQNLYSLREQGMPLVIAHKGLSSILPENTTEAVILSLDYAELTEFDVMLTYDNQLVVFHDDHLSRMTNVADCPQFAHKKRSGKNHDQILNDWWITDFTLEQLRTLKLKQGQQPSKRSILWNYVYSIPTLKSFLERILLSKANRKNKKSGLMIELKEQQGKTSYQMSEPFISLMKQLNISSIQECQTAQLPIFVGSFNQQMLAHVHSETNLPLIRLLQHNQNCNLVQVSRSCCAIGIGQKQLLQSDFRIINECHQLNLGVVYWTIRTDTLPIPFGCKNYQQAHIKLIRSGIDGIITQFPQTASTIVKMIDYIK